MKEKKLCQLTAHPIKTKSEVDLKVGASMRASLSPHPHPMIPPIFSDRGIQVRPARICKQLWHLYLSPKNLKQEGKISLMQENPSPAKHQSSSPDILHREVSTLCGDPPGAE
jgi:hypothetical protein